MSSSSVPILLAVSMLLSGLAAADPVDVDPTGDASGDAVAVSGTGNARGTGYYCDEVFSIVCVGSVVVSGTGTADCRHTYYGYEYECLPTLGASGTGTAAGEVAASGTGSSQGSMVAVSGTGTAGCFTYYGYYETCPLLAVSGDEARGAFAVGPNACNGRQCVVVSPEGDANGGLVAIAPMGNADGGIAVGGNDAKGNLAVAGTGSASESGAIPRFGVARVSAAGPSSGSGYLSASATGDASDGIVDVSGTGSTNGYSLLSLAPGGNGRGGNVVIGGTSAECQYQCVAVTRTGDASCWYYDNYGYDLCVKASGDGRAHGGVGNMGLPSGIVLDAPATPGVDPMSVGTPATTFPGVCAGAIVCVGTFTINAQHIGDTPEVPSTWPGTFGVDVEFMRPFVEAQAAGATTIPPTTVIVPVPAVGNVPVTICPAGCTVPSATPNAGGAVAITIWAGTGAPTVVTIPLGPPPLPETPGIPMLP